MEKAQNENETAYYDNKGKDLKGQPTSVDRDVPGDCYKGYIMVHGYGVYHGLLISRKCVVKCIVIKQD